MRMTLISDFSILTSHILKSSYPHILLPLPAVDDRKTITTVSRPLEERSLEADPFAQFARWFREATEEAIPLAEGMALATVTADGRPSCRIVLLKDHGEDGFTFYTNYGSPKAEQLESNGRAAGTFWWVALGRQIRIEGTVTRVSAETSDEYFATRPRMSQLSAWASRQSEPVSSREELDLQLQRVSKRFAGVPVPRPPYWGGYLLVPDKIEFWQGREGRMHDRIVYERESNGVWKVSRLAP